MSQELIDELKEDAAYMSRMDSSGMYVPRETVNAILAELQRLKRIEAAASFVNERFAGQSGNFVFSQRHALERLAAALAPQPEGEQQG